MARPRSISNEAILAETYELLMEIGPSRFTFERLGERVGLVPAALSRRFKSKKQLLLEVDRYALERISKETYKAIRETKSPIEAIITQFVTEMKYATTVERFTNGQEFLLQDLRDKDLYDSYQISSERRHLHVVQLLVRAQEDGLLQGIDNFNELARLLEMIARGAGHVWATTQQDTVEECIRRYIMLALKPYTSR
jgi:AcrR family transcriptional regulator